MASRRNTICVTCTGQKINAQGKPAFPKLKEIKSEMEDLRMTRKLMGYLLAALALTLFASTASAAFIQCQTIGSPSGSVPLTGQPVTLTCPAFVVPASNTLTGVELELIDDAQGPSSIGSTIQWTWNTFVGVSQLGSQINIETSPDGATFGPCSALGGSIVNTCPSFLGPYAQNIAAGGTFNAVSVNASAIATAGGLSSGGSDSVRLFVQYDLTPQTGVPEPVTLSLVGFGLLGVGLLARKRRKV
jgi:hypothetical protein